MVGYTRNKLFRKIFVLHKFETVYLKILLEDICQIVDHQFVTCNYKDLLCTWVQCVLQTKITNWNKSSSDIISVRKQPRFINEQKNENSKMLSKWFCHNVRR